MKSAQVFPSWISTAKTRFGDIKHVDGTIVEDEKDVRVFLKELLKEKYNVLTANNGAEAVEAIKKEMPDIIISDLMMPEMDGMELCKIIRSNILTCHIPYIMLTSKNSVINSIEGLESGANSYLSLIHI